MHGPVTPERVYFAENKAKPCRKQSDAFKRLLELIKSEVRTYRRLSLQHILGRVTLGPYPDHPLPEFRNSLSLSLPWPIAGQIQMIL